MQELFEALHSQLRAGKPGYHRTSYMVKENSFFNIPASKEVRQTSHACGTVFQQHVFGFNAAGAYGWVDVVCVLLRQARCNRGIDCLRSARQTKSLLLYCTLQYQQHMLSAQALCTVC
jgi:hypothetical protein